MGEPVVSTSWPAPLCSWEASQRESAHNSARISRHPAYSMHPSLHRHGSCSSPVFQVPPLRYAVSASDFDCDDLALGHTKGRNSKRSHVVRGSVAPSRLLLLAGRFFSKRAARTAAQRAGTVGRIGADAYYRTRGRRQVKPTASRIPPARARIPPSGWLSDVHCSAGASQMPLGSVTTSSAVRVPLVVRVAGFQVRQKMEMWMMAIFTPMRCPTATVPAGHERMRSVPPLPPA